LSSGGGRLQRLRVCPGGEGYAGRFSRTARASAATNRGCGLRGGPAVPVKVGCSCFRVDMGELPYHLRMNGTSHSGRVASGGPSGVRSPAGVRGTEAGSTGARTEPISWVREQGFRGDIAERQGGGLDGVLAKGTLDRGPGSIRFPGPSPHRPRLEGRSRRRPRGGRRAEPVDPASVKSEALATHRGNPAGGGRHGRTQPPPTYFTGIPL
jgi:hypothetical protein